MKGTAYSALTIVNAMANGKGGAIGIDLEVTADITIVDEGVKGSIEVRGEKYSDFTLIKEIKKTIEKEFDLDFGITLDVRSGIPIGKGLKSSSAVSNAVSEAILKSLDIEVDDEKIIEIGIKGSRKAGVTLTGAYDDAYASFHGGVCLTDNTKNEVLRREKIGKKPVVILLPEQTVLTNSLKNEDFKEIRPFIDIIFDSALQGSWKEACFLNGMVYSLFFDYDSTVMKKVLELSDVVGLSGKGPAFYSITDKPEEVKEKWIAFGKLIETKTR